MAKFLAVFMAPAGGGERPDEATMARGMQAWGQWMQDHAGQIADTGGPLGKTRKVSKGGIADASNNLAGYVVVEAPDQEAAAKLFENHPSFAIFPGDGVEVMPILPIPGAG
ncbi:MAG TPA: hypothetical protein VGH15_12180 [Caulobacteraceae bacterium]|jgi:hypothetical protein